MVLLRNVPYKTGKTGGINLVQVTMICFDARKKVLQLFGMTPFHSAVMLVLLIFTIVMVYVYGFKMRAAALLEELKSTDTASTSAPTTSSLLSNNPAAQQHASAPAQSSEPALSSASSRKGTFSGVW